MRDLLNKVLGRGKSDSREEAKQRLKFLLIHDQVDLTPGQLASMKEEIMEVISRYVEIDDQNTDFRLERLEKEVALVSSVPVRRVIARSGATVTA